MNNIQEYQNNIKEMIWAIQENIDYLREKGNYRLEIKNGFLIENCANIHYIYKFKLDLPQEIDPDTDIEVMTGNEHITGRVIAIENQTIQLELDRNIGDTVTSAILVISSYHLLLLLSERLKAVDNGEIVLTALAYKIWNFDEFLNDNQSQTIATIVRPDNIQFNLNHFQEKAVNLVRDNEISFIWGPPGTGKTQTIARIIENCINSNLRVLLLAHTNIATDGALLKVVEFLKDSKIYQEGKILRYGDNNYPELKKYPKVNPLNIAFEKVGEHLKNEYIRIKKQIEVLKESNDLNSKQGLEDLKQRKNIINGKIIEIMEMLLKEAKIIATTLTRSYSNKLIMNQNYDCVIIDEASMAPLPALWFAVGLAKQKAVIVGDFLQLPPITKYKGKNPIYINKWLKRNIFEKVGIESKIKSGEKPEGLEQLKIQYRMHPHIANLINNLVYEIKSPEFKLKSDSSTEHLGIELVDKAPLESSHVGIYDTSKEHAVVIKTDSGSYYNLYQAFLSVKLAEIAKNNGYKSIAILSPFRSQVNLLRKILKDENLLDSIEANTVHKFQGREKQIIIFDITTPYQTLLTDDGHEGGDDEKLLNVAFSRAQEKCVMIADIEEVKKTHSSSSLIRQFITHCNKNNYPVIRDEETIKKFLIKETLENHLKKSVLDNIPKSSLLEDNDFYKFFINDLLKANREIIIESPFLSFQTSSLLFQVLSKLRSDNINIFIFTNPLKKYPESKRSEIRSIMEKFEEIGIIILPDTDHPRNIAVIDRKIIWEGDINLFSSENNLNKQMHRFECPATAQQLLRFHKIDKNIGEIGENKIKRCQFCKEPGSWYWEAKSKWDGKNRTYCLMGEHNKDEKPPVLGNEELNLIKWVKEQSDWGKQAKLAKENDMLQPVDRRFLFKIGQKILKNQDISYKEARYASGLYKKLTELLNKQSDCIR